MKSLPGSLRRPHAARPLLLAVAVAVAWTTLGASAADKRDPDKGRALAAVVRGERPAGPTFSKGTLRVRTGDGRRLSVPVEVQVEVGTNAWNTVYRAQFTDGRRETLTVVNPPDRPPHFILHRGSGDGNITEVRPERPDEMFNAFAGTDFWFIDLGMVFLHWPEQNWIGKETRRTRACNLLESVNPAPVPGSYKRVVTWVDEETGGIVRAEAYDQQNKLLKEFSPGSFARVGNRFELREMEIRNEQTDSRTTLQFDIEDPDKLGVKHLPTVK